MKKFYIDFSGYCTVEAENSEEAFNKFQETLQEPCTACCDAVYDIDAVEEKEDS